VTDGVVAGGDVLFARGTRLFRASFRKAAPVQLVIEVSVTC
jgi:hypothetical protein